MGGQAGSKRVGGKCGSYASGGNGGNYSTSSKRGSAGFGGGGASAVLRGNTAGSLANSSIRSNALIVAGGGGGATGGGVYVTSSTRMYTYIGYGGAGGNGALAEDGTMSGGDGYGFILKTYPDDHDPSDEYSKGGHSTDGTIVYGQLGVGQSGVNGNSSDVGKGAENGRGGAGGGWVGGTACQRTQYGSYPGGGGGSSYVLPSLHNLVYGAEEFVPKLGRYDNGQSSESDGYASIRLYKTHFTSKLTTDSTCNIGGTLKLTIDNPYPSTVYHKVSALYTAEISTDETEGVDIYSFDVDIPTGTTEYDLSIPAELANHITTSTSGSLQIQLMTYANDGTYAGKVTQTITVKVPEYIGDTYMYPSITLNAPENVSDLDDSTIGLVGGHSAYKYSFTTSGVYGSTIKRREYRTNQNYRWSTFTGNEVTIDPIPVGMQTVYFRVTDSRSRSTTVEYKHANPAAKYVAPGVDVTLYRCLSDGTPDSMGQYCYMRGNIAGSDVYGTNTISATAYYRISNSMDSWTPIGTWSQDLTAEYDIPELIFGDGNLDIEKAYDIRFEAVDEVTAKSYVYELDSAMFTLYLKQGGNAVGLGCPTDKEYAVVIDKDWTLYHGQTNL